MVLNENCSSEGLCCCRWTVITIFVLDKHDISSFWNSFVMHFDGESFSRNTSWSKFNHLVWFQDTLFNTSGNDITNTFDFVDTRNRHSEWLLSWSLWTRYNIVQCI